MFEQDVRLDGKVALVTGASRGLGYETARYLGHMGASVVIADIDKKSADEACHILTGEGVDAIAIHVDMGDRESIRSMIDQVRAQMKKIDILVNNAGIFDSRPIPDIPPEAWERVINVNLSGMHYCSQMVIGEMIERKSGKIVNLSSMSAQTGGLKGGVNYATSKAGALGLTKSYARYCAPHGITVNAVAPGLIRSEMTKSWAEPSSVPQGRLGEPLDVARVVYFLCTPLSDYVTGQMIAINGGLVMS